MSSSENIELLNEMFLGAEASHESSGYEGILSSGMFRRSRDLDLDRSAGETAAKAYRCSKSRNRIRHNGTSPAGASFSISLL